MLYVYYTYNSTWTNYALNGIRRRRGSISGSTGLRSTKRRPCLPVADPVHSASEDRFYLLGLSARLRVLVVVHCYRVDDEIVRLISARKATSSERVQYDARWKR